MYNFRIKDFAYRHLADVGFFTNRFQVDILEQNVYPWLTKKVAKFVTQLDEVGRFPDEFVLSYFDEYEQQHA